MIIEVADPSDPRIAPYMQVRDRDHAVGAGTFLIEGAVTLARQVAASRFPLVSALVAGNRLHALAPLLEQLPPDLPVYVAPRAVMDAVVGFPIHRGVLALAQRGETQTVEALLPSLPASRPLTLLALVGLSNHDNVGACFRNAAAFGADAVLLDGTSCDPLYRKAIRVSAGNALAVPFARSGDGMNLAASLHRHGVECWSLTPAGGAPLQSLEPPPRLALLLGAEGPGLPPDLMDSTRRVTIPMAAGVDSLNVATAGAVALAHIFARRSC